MTVKRIDGFNRGPRSAGCGASALCGWGVVLMVLVAGHLAPVLRLEESGESLDSNLTQMVVRGVRNVLY